MPQLMPGGEEPRVPLPSPAVVPLRVYVPELSRKVAVTDLAAAMVTWQEPVPVQAASPPEPERASEARAF